MIGAQSGVKLAAATKSLRTTVARSQELTRDLEAVRNELKAKDDELEVVSNKTVDVCAYSIPGYLEFFCIALKR